MTPNGCAQKNLTVGEFFGAVKAPLPGPPGDVNASTCTLRALAVTGAIQLSSAVLSAASISDEEQSCCDLCYGTPTCLYYGYYSQDGATTTNCTLYSGASTAPAAAAAGSWSYGALTAAAPPLCSVRLGTCTSTSQPILASVALPPGQPYMCCSQCSQQAGCGSWSYDSDSGVCSLLGGACTNATVPTSCSNVFSGTFLAYPPPSPPRPPSPSPPAPPPSPLSLPPSPLPPSPPRCFPAASFPAAAPLFADIC